MNVADLCMSDDTTISEKMWKLWEKANSEFFEFSEEAPTS